MWVSTSRTDSTAWGLGAGSCCAVIWGGAGSSDMTCAASAWASGHYFKWRPRRKRYFSALNRRAIRPHMYNGRSCFAAAVSSQCTIRLSLTYVLAPPPHASLVAPLGVACADGVLAPAAERRGDRRRSLCRVSRSHRPRPVRRQALGPAGLRVCAAARIVPRRAPLGRAARTGAAPARLPSRERTAACGHVYAFLRPLPPHDATLHL